MFEPINGRVNMIVEFALLAWQGNIGRLVKYFGKSLNFRLVINAEIVQRILQIVKMIRVGGFAHSG